MHFLNFLNTTSQITMFVCLQTQTKTKITNFDPFIMNQSVVQQL